MDLESIFADQSTIQINVMKVDGRKLTKGLMDQFLYKVPFDEYYNFTGDKIFGYVKMEVKRQGSNPPEIDRHWAIAQYEGKIVKFSFDHFLSIGKLKFDSLVYRNNSSLFFELVRKMESPYKAEYLEDDGHFNKYNVIYDVTFEQLFTDETLKKLKIIIENAQKISVALVQHQIYI